MSPSRSARSGAPHKRRGTNGATISVEYHNPSARRPKKPFTPTRNPTRCRCGPKIARGDRRRRRAVKRLRHVCTNLGRSKTWPRACARARPGPHAATSPTFPTRRSLHASACGAPKPRRALHDWATDLAVRYGAVSIPVVVVVWAPQLFEKLSPKGANVP